MGTRRTSGTIVATLQAGNVVTSDELRGAGNARLIITAVNRDGTLEVATLARRGRRTWRKVHATRVTKVAESTEAAS